MNTMTKLYIFETIPKEQRTPERTGWRYAIQAKEVPSAFARTLLLTSDIAVLSVVVAIAITTHAPMLIIVGIELLFPLVQPAGNPGLLAFNLGLAVALCWFGWTRRPQYLLVVRLHEVQEQLRQQMVRSEELATERERTRIARDIHDVLSHSLAVLSIQVQAARQLVTRDPERLATKLDDMAVLIRESITESRRLVGLLREPSPASSRSDDVSANLRSIATTFNERTGIHCRFEESGTPHKLHAQQHETLQLALREMLTNTHRHGTAQTVWITLRWREASVTFVKTHINHIFSKLGARDRAQVIVKARQLGLA